MGASRFAARDVHRIGILDIRIWNTDRHAGNILVRRPRESSLGLSGLAKLDFNQLELVPIDHGFCLPESLEPPYFEWLHWPQVHSLPYTCLTSSVRLRGLVAITSGILGTTKQTELLRSLHIYSCPLKVGILMVTVSLLQV